MIDWKEGRGKGPLLSGEEGKALLYEKKIKWLNLGGEGGESKGGSVNHWTLLLFFI